MQCCGTICHSDTIRHLREKILLKSKFGTVYDSSPHRQNHHGLFFSSVPESLSHLYLLLPLFSFCHPVLQSGTVDIES